MNLTDGQRIEMPNGVQTVAHPGHLPGERWRLVHPWAAWAVTDAGDIVTLTTDRRGKPTTRQTGWTLRDLREG